MYYGQPFGAFGDPDKHIKSMEIEPTGSGARVRILAAPNLGNAYYQVYVNNVFGGSIWCAEGVTSEWLNLVISGSDSASIVAFRIGASPDFDNSSFAALDEEAPQKVTASWTWPYEVIGTPDNTDLTAWSLSNLLKAQVNQGDLETRGILSVTMEVSGGTATVTVGDIASGSGAVGGAVTLTALNSSGVTGSVTVDAGAVTGSGNLAVRWPKSMQILRDQVDPPTTVIATSPYIDGDTGGMVDPDTLAVGTYYYAFRAISDTDDIGDKSASTTITVSGAPVAPTDLAYVSGNAAATVVSWTASTTAGATYNIYIANPDDDYLDTETPAATAIAGSTGATLPAITGYPGTAQVLVRAELGGVEELNGDILYIEYDASGARVNPRPNEPSVTSVSVSSGLQISAVGSYDPSGEDGAGTSLQLFVRTPSGSYNFALPDDTTALGAEINGYKSATMTSTEAVGWHYITMKAVTAAGTQSVGYAPEVAVYVSDVNAAAPTGTFTLSRG
jgi:hypothetical protein